MVKKISRLQIAPHTLQNALDSFDLRGVNTTIRLLQDGSCTLGYELPCRASFLGGHDPFDSSVFQVSLTNDPSIPLHAVHQSRSRGGCDEETVSKLRLRERSKSNEMSQSPELHLTHACTS